MTTLNKKEIPQEISIFPLANAVFFPNTILPLNIFEPRYKKMVEDALSSNKMIGMIQTKQNNNIYKFLINKNYSLLWNYRWSFIFKRKLLNYRHTTF